MRSKQLFSIILTLALSLSLLFVVNLGAYGVDSNVSVTVTSGILSLTIDETSYDFGTVDSTDIDNGSVSTGAGDSTYGNVLTAKSNTDWGVQVETTDSDLGTNNGYSKQLSDFQFQAAKKSSGGNFTADITSWTAITNSNQTLATGGPGANLEIGMDYKILLGMQDRGGTYSVTLTYTIFSTGGSA